MFETGSDVRRGNLWRLRAACFFQVFSFGILWSFSSVWMKEHGIGETLIGIISSTHIAVGLIFGLFWGIVSDRTARPDRVVMIGSVGLFIGFAFLSVCHTIKDFFLWSVIIGITLPMILTQMPVLAVSAISSKASGRGYASYRVFGSIGYILGTLLMPRVVDDMDKLFLVASVSMLISTIPIVFMSVSQRVEKSDRGSVSAILDNRSLLNFLFAVFFFSLALPAVFNFTYVFANDLGADSSFIGLLGAFQGCVALIALPVLGRGVDRIGARWILLFAFLAMPLRAASLVFIESPVWLLAPILFHFFTWAGFEVAGVLFVSRLADLQNRGMAQAMFVGIQGFGHLVGSTVLGFIAEQYGYPYMYSAGALLALFGLLFFLRQHWFSPDYEISTH